MILKQYWGDHIRYIIVDEGQKGSCQLNIYYEQQDFGSRACLFDLYVDDHSRERGIASQLLDKAEEIAKSQDCEDIVVEYDSLQSQPFVAGIYYRRGYSAKNITFKKTLND